MPQASLILFECLKNPEVLDFLSKPEKESEFARSKLDSEPLARKQSPSEIVEYIKESSRLIVRFISLIEINLTSEFYRVNESLTPERREIHKDLIDFVIGFFGNSKEFIDSQTVLDLMIHKVAEKIEPLYDQEEILFVGLQNLADTALWIYFEPCKSELPAVSQSGKSVENVLADLITIMKKISSSIDDKASNEICVQRILDILCPKQDEALVELPFENSARSFQCEYKLSEQSLDSYLYFVNEDIVREFNLKPGKYHSLYFSVVQSSGYGKTRMLMEAGKNKLHTIYACLREPKSSGYPMSNTTVREMIDQCKNIEDFKFFLATIYMVSLHYLGLGTSLPENFDPNFHFPLQKFADTGRLEDPKFKDFWDVIKINFDDSFKNFEHRRNAVRLVEHYQENYRKVLVDGKYRCDHGFLYSEAGIVPRELVLVLDEARYLLEGSQDKSKFRLLRAAHRSMVNSNFVLCFVDTTSTISNFAPAYHHDPSARLMKKFDLLPIYYTVLTYNSVCYKAANKESREEQLAELFSKGRPLWTSSCFTSRTISMYEIVSAIMFAMIKLSNQPIPDLNANFFGRLAAMAIRFGLWGIMDHSFSSAFVSSYMGTALHFGEDRVRMFVHFVPEPILSEAACHLLHTYSEDLCRTDSDFPSKVLTEGLESFEASIISGFLDVGNVGECVFRIVISLVHDYLRRKCTPIGKTLIYSEPIKFSDFMDALVTNEYKGMYRKTFGQGCCKMSHPDIEKLRKQGEVCFTTFEVMEGEAKITLTQKLLMRAYEHRFAFIGADNQEGVDLIIPVKMFNGKYTAFIIQLKSFFDPTTAQSARFNAAGPMLAPKSCFKKHELKAYASMYCELNFSGVLANVNEPTKKRAKVHFANYGNHIMLLDLSTVQGVCPAVKTILAALKSKRVDYVNKRGNLQKLKIMDPHRYGGL